MYYNFTVATIPFVYLTSAPFSGSTLFSFLVNTHPMIATVGEMTGPVRSTDPASYKCSCGRKIRECGFWRRVAEQMAARRFLFEPGYFDTRIRLGSSSVAHRILSGSLRTTRLEDFRSEVLRLWPIQEQRLQYLVRRNMALAESILEVTGKPIFFDASKDPMAIRLFMSQSDVDLRVVHLVRDVRGASLSRSKNRGEKNWRRNVKAWVRTNYTIERQLERLQTDRWTRVRYEDLCRDPAATLNRFFEFCGLAPHSGSHDFHAREHHVVGNRMRLASVGQIQLDDGWRRSLTLEELRWAERIAGSMQTRYGYPEMTAADLDQGPSR